MLPPSIHAGVTLLGASACFVTALFVAPDGDNTGVLLLLGLGELLFLYQLLKQSSRSYKQDVAGMTLAVFVLLVIAWFVVSAIAHYQF